MDKLYANEHLKHPTWATGTLLLGMQEPPKGERAAPAAHGAHAAAAPAASPAATPAASPAAAAPAAAEPPKETP
jgi:hypothetical protein